MPFPLQKTQDTPHRVVFLGYSSRAPGGPGHFGSDGPSTLIDLMSYFLDLIGLQLVDLA